MKGYESLVKTSELGNIKRFNEVLELNEGNYGVFSSYESNDLKLIQVFGENPIENNYKLKANFN
jgi:hypothetical protein